MSFYKLLEGIREIKRFQLMQRSHQELELRLITNEKEVAFEKAKADLQNFLDSRNITDVEILLSDESPQASKVSDKYNHVHKDFKDY